MRPTDWAPLADGDPVPGDPLTIDSLVTHLEGIASTIREQMSRFTAIDAGEIWDSDSADKFIEMQAKLPPDLDLVATRYEGVASALSTWSSALTDAQGEADQALIDAKAAQEDIDAAERGIDDMEQFAQDASEQANTTNAANPEAPPVEPEQWSGPDHYALKGEAEGRLQDARDKLAAAVEARDEAQGIAAGDIGDALDDDLKNRGGLFGFFDDVKYAVIEWAEANADWLNVLSDVLAIAGAIVGLLSIAFPVLAPLALALGVASLLVDSVLFMAGEKSWVDLGMDLLGIVTFGAGRAFGGAARAVSRAGRARAVVQSSNLRVANLTTRLDDAVAARNALSTSVQLGRNGRPLAGAARNSRIARLTREADAGIDTINNSLSAANRTAGRASALYDDIATRLPTRGWPGWSNVRNGFNPVQVVRDAGGASSSVTANLDLVEANLRGLNGGYAFTGQVVDAGGGTLIGAAQGIPAANNMAERIAGP